MKRRTFLGLSVAAVVPWLSGCADPSAVLVMDEVSDREVADRASRDVDSHPGARSVVSDAVENGSATATGRRPPIDGEAPVAYEDRFYDLSVTETDRWEATQYEVEVDYDPGDFDGTTVEYAELSDVDRETVDRLLPPPEDDPGGEGYDFGTGRVYSEEEAERSVLVPDPEYDAVVHEGTAYPVRAGDARTVTVSEYRYDADLVAADAAEFAEALRDEFLFELSGLSADERDVVSEATDGGYYEGEATDAFESLVGRFREHEAVESDEWGGEWLARYDGTVYWSDLKHPPGAGGE